MLKTLEIRTRARTNHDCMHRSACLGLLLKRIDADKVPCSTDKVLVMDCDGCRRYEQQPLDQWHRIKLLQLARAILCDSTQ
jgi:hypothetical protein